MQMQSDIADFIVNATALPNAPFECAAISGNKQATISWDAVDGAKSYNLYYSTMSGLTKSTGMKISGVISPYTQTGLTNGTTYYYIVTAVNAIGESSPSSQVSVRGGLLGGACQGKELFLSRSTFPVYLLAGLNSCGYVNGRGDLARFNNPDGITTDGVNLYVTDFSNNVIRKIVIATGEVTTLAGLGPSSPGDADTSLGTAASFNGPCGVTTDGVNLYVTECIGNVIRKVVISSGEVTTLAGTLASKAIDAATGGIATFNYPYGITTDGTNLYVSDMHNNTIRKIVISTRVVSTLVTGLHDPAGIMTDGVTLYLAERGTGVIQKIDISTGAMSPLASSFNSPYGITTDGANLYVADSGNGSIRKIVIANGAVSTLSSIFNGSQGLTTDGTNLYVADTNIHEIRVIK